ncbi:MAG TPA: glycosyltransferase family 9 protein [Pirellulales bacterium]|nr:glycosyltransferase family 9 protein [Pirellulales bacterium]
MPLDLQKIRRIALVRNNHMGDLVCTLPAFEALRTGLPHAHITAIVNPGAAPLLNKHPHVDDLLFDDELDPPEQLTALLKAGRFDAVLVTFCTRRNAWAAFRARVPIRVTHGRRWFQALCGTHRCYASRKKPPYHESSFILTFTQRLGIPLTLEQARPYLFVDPAERARVEERITSRIGRQGPLFAVHPGSRKSAFNWPVESYYRTVERLAQVGRVILTGSDPDRPQLDWIESRLTPALRERVMMLTDLSLPQLVAGLSLVDAFVSSSTGPLHIAAIVSGHALGLYSDAFYLHPRRWGPIGPNSSVLISEWKFPEPPLIRSPRAEEHMAQITVDAVVERMLHPVPMRSAA